MRVHHLAVLAGLALLVPAVGADHVYSHRYLVQGRVLDAGGLPLEGVFVYVGTKGFRAEGLCPGTSFEDARTDEHGDFAYCLHAHALRENATVSLSVGEAVFELAADRDLRVTTLYFEVPNATGAAPEGWGRTYDVDGKVWRGTRPGNHDDVPVTGVPVVDEPVQIRVETAGAVFEAEVVTDRYGEFAARVHLPVDVDGGKIVVTAANESREAPLDDTHLRSRIDVKMLGDESHPDVEEMEAPPPDVRSTFVNPSPAASAPAPGSDSPPFLGSAAFWILVIALVGLAAAGVTLSVARK